MSILTLGRPTPRRSDLARSEIIDRPPPLDHWAREMEFPFTRHTSFAAYLRELRRDHPGIYALLSAARVAPIAAQRYFAALDARSWEFEESDTGGRGVAYNQAQIDPSGRSIGMLALLHLFGSSFDGIPPSNWLLLDALGGDGTLARLARRHDIHARIVTADISGLMVDSARAAGLPAIRQAAGASLFRDGTLDGVLIGYGTHHLSPQERDDAIAEARRTLKPGRRVVVHDFEEGGPVARWFADVVHPYSRTGHPHPHFSRAELLIRFTRAGFSDIRIMDMPDPFTIHGATPGEAQERLIEHLYLMYDLVKLANWHKALPPLAEGTLGRIEVERGPLGYVASVPRTALVAVGTK